MRAVLAVILAACLLVTGSVIIRGEPPAPATEPGPPATGEDLWQSLPAELLGDVIESKLEAIGSHRSSIRRLEAELARVREIQKIKMSEARPPPE